jgi:hypothetical protein
MKTLITSLIAIGMILFASSAIAQNVHIVDANPNSPDGPNYFSDLQSAIDAAATGDTLIVVPASSFYEANLNKQLVFIGPGLDDRVLPNGQLAEVRIKIQNSATDGSLVQGLRVYLSEPQYIGAGNPVITLQNCIVRGGPGSAPSTNTRVHIRNSYLAQIVYTRGIIENSVINNLGFVGTFRNNILLGFSGFGDSFDPTNPDRITTNVYNNIFTAGLYNSVSTTAFNNNLFTSDVTIDTEGTGNMDTNNLFETDPLFTNPSPNNIFDRDYSLMPASPGAGFGTDGTDVGIFGGNFPFVTLENGLMVLPVVREMSVTGVVSEGGQVRLEAVLSNASND